MSVVVRWAVNVNAWDPTPEQWATVLGCLPAEEQQKCCAFRHADDQKRSVVSQLLQRACVSFALGEPWQQVQLQRTKGRKPFYAGSAPRQHAPNFNFNVSHEGEFVVLASEGHCICGVDVAAPQQLRRRGSSSLVDSISLMKTQLCDKEWELLQSLKDDDAALEAAFQGIWSCKEAFIKARGDGVGFEPLSRIEVLLPRLSAELWAAQPVQPVQLRVDGELQQRWRLHLQQLPRGHWVAVARAPPEAVVDAYGVFRSTLKQPIMSDQQLQVYLDASSPAFDMLTVEDLLPNDVLDRYNDC